MRRRGSRPIVQLLFNLARLLLPLAVIGMAAWWFLNRDLTPQGALRITSTVPGADIHIDGVQSGALTDTVLQTVEVGRRFVTVRLPGYVADPEVAIVEIQAGRTAVARFVLHDSAKAITRDEFPPARDVRQEIFVIGEGAMHAIPAAPPRRTLLDFSQAEVETSPRATSTRPPPQHTSESVATSSDPILAESRQALTNTQIAVTSTPEGAGILVNGARTDLKTPYTFRGLDRGVYVFKLDKQGFVAQPESIQVFLSHSEQSELAAFSLRSLIDLPEPVLTVQTKPLAAGIKVNGTAAGVGSVRTVVNFGRHVVEFASVPGYKTPDPLTVEVTPDRPTADVSGTYERLRGKAYLAVVPDQSISRFDGEKLRIFVDNELILDGSKDRFDATLHGKLYPGERAVRIQYGDLSSEELVHLADDQVAEVTLRVDAMFSKRKLKLKAKTEIPLEDWQDKHKKSTVLTQS